MTTRAKAPAKPSTPPPSAPEVINLAGENEGKGLQSSAVTHKKLTDLTPDMRNANKGTERGSEMIRASLEEYGAGRSLVADKHLRVIGGNKTLEQAGALGMDDIIVVQTTGDKLVVVQRMDLDLETDAKAKELAIADNRAGQVSLNWDPKVLAEFRSEVDLDKFWNKDELVVFFAGTGELKTDEDDVPPTPAEPKTKVGDLYVMGGHRLLCGDSTKREDVERLMGAKKADIVFTDPPYGVSIGSKNQGLNNIQPSDRQTANIENDTLDPDALKAILLPAFENCRNAMAEHCSVYVTSPQGGGLSMMMMMMMMMEAGLKVRHVLIWVKNSATFSIGRLDYDYQHEPILFTWGKNHRRYDKGEHRTSCWFIDKPRESNLHPTMKPVALIENALLNSSQGDDIVLDLFGGSGSTMIAAEKVGRRCYMMEISPAYCDVICERYYRATGKLPIKQDGEGGWKP